MSSKTLEELLEERTALMNELSKLNLIVHGSIVQRRTMCTKEECEKCHSGEKHGPFSSFSVNRDGKQRQKYIPKSMEEKAHHCIEAYNHAMTLINQISDINIQLISMKYMD